MTRTILLSVHIIGVAAWLGANLVQLVLAPRFVRAPAAVAAAWSRQTIWLGQRYYTVAGGVIGITGVLLVVDGDWSWSSGFIWVGVSVLVVGAVMGAAFFGPLAERRAHALDVDDAPTAAAAQRRIVPLGVLDTALVVLALVAMVHKWAA